MSFHLDPILEADCHPLGVNGTTRLLLNRNALYPWFILVPDTDEIEFYQLAHSQQLDVLALINQLSLFIKSHFRTDKLNIATIGNIVSQLHVHVIGRHQSDPCWPGVVWGSDKSEKYSSSRLAEIKSQLQQEQVLTT